MGGEEFALEKAIRRLVLPECWSARSRVHPRPLRLRSEIDPRLRPQESCLCDSERHRLARDVPGVPAALDGPHRIREEGVALSGTSPPEERIAKSIARLGGDPQPGLARGRKLGTGDCRLGPKRA